jgi:dipeptidyl aminopeptidase/acylaminoacyl peptidase
MLVRPRPAVALCFALSTLTSFSVPSPAFAQPRRAMTIDDVIDLVQVSAPRKSPDGRRVLYTVSELGKWKDNKRVTSIWIADADGSSARRFLAREKDRAPALEGAGAKRQRARDAQKSSDQ